MIVIVSQFIGPAVDEFAPRITSFSRCRLSGTMDGVRVQIVLAAHFPHKVRWKKITKVIVAKGTVLTPDQAKFARTAIGG